MWGDGGNSHLARNSIRVLRETSNAAYGAHFAEIVIISELWLTIL